MTTEQDPGTTSETAGESAGSDQGRPAALARKAPARRKAATSPDDAAGVTSASAELSGIELPAPKKTTRAPRKAAPPKQIEALVDLSAAENAHEARVSGTEAGEGAPKAKASRATSAKATRATKGAATGPEPGVAASDAATPASAGHGPAFIGALPPEQPKTPAPRLATTALLFQAPEPTAAPVRAAAVAPEAESAGEPRAPRAAAAKTQAAKPPKAKSAKSAKDAEEPAPVAPQDAPAPGDDDGGEPGAGGKKRRRGGRGRRGKGGKGEETQGASENQGGQAPAGQAAEGEGRAARAAQVDAGDAESSSRRRRRRTRTGSEETHSDEVTALKGSTRLEAKKLRRREGRDAGRRRATITESEFLARRESVTRTMVVREKEGRTQIAVMEDGVLVEHYVSRRTQSSMVGNVYLGRVQNVLPSMEAAFVDIGKGRNAVLYAGEVNWDAAGLEGQPRRIEQALSSGDSVLVQVTKDPIGHKGARLTSQITLAGRYLVFVPGGGMSGISRKLPDTERTRLKKLLNEIVPESAGVIVRTAAEGAAEDELRRDVERLSKQWARIEKKTKTASAPAILQEEPDLAIRVIRDIFNEDFAELIVSGTDVWEQLSDYIGQVAPDLAEKMSRWTGQGDVFAKYRIDEQLAKGMDRKVWLPSGGSLVIDRTEAMSVIDVNTGKFTGAGGTLEETVTRNNLEAAEEIVRQLRLRDIGGIIVIDFIDMVLESNRDLVLRRLIECLGRDRTRHQVAEVTSLGLVQMTRKRVGQGLVEAFSEPCEACGGRGFIVHSDPVERSGAQSSSDGGQRRKRARQEPAVTVPVLPEASSEQRQAVNATLASIAAAAAQAHDESVPSSRSDGAAPLKKDEEWIVGDVDGEIESEVGLPPQGDPTAALPANLTTIPGTDILVFADPAPAAAEADEPVVLSDADEEATGRDEDGSRVVGDVPGEGESQSGTDEGEPAGEEL